MPSKKTLVLFLAIFVSCLYSPCVEAQEDQAKFTYAVIASNCIYAPKRRALTGFRVKGTKGIITALHGVADSRTITAQSAGGRLLSQRLKIVKVDVARDLALLSSPELERLPSEGFVPAQVSKWDSLTKVKVTGYPVNIDLRNITTSLDVRRPALTSLRILVGATQRVALSRRKSPDPDIQVLSIEGYLLPGHSGAPVLDANGRVVAVGNGGLKNGTVGIGWAIPLQHVRWQSVNQKRLDALGAPNTGALFSLEEDVEGVKEAVYAVTRSIITEQREIDEIERIFLESIIKNRVEAVRLFVKNDPSLAIRFFDPALIMELSRAYTKPGEESDPISMNALTLASLYGQNQVCVELIQAGARVNDAGGMGITPLMIASAVGIPFGKPSHATTVQTLIKNGADVNQRSQQMNNQTALMLAVINGATSHVKLLLEAGANPNLVADDGYTALDFAKEFQHDDEALHSLLVNAGAKEGE